MCFYLCPVDFLVMSDFDAYKEQVDQCVQFYSTKTGLNWHVSDVVKSMFENGVYSFDLVLCSDDQCTMRSFSWKEGIVTQTK